MGLLLKPEPGPSPK